MSSTMNKCLTTILPDVKQRCGLRWSTLVHEVDKTAIMQRDLHETRIKDDTTKHDSKASKRREEKLSRIEALSTPRSYLQNTATASDIYKKKKSAQNATLAPKKTGTTTSSNPSPMKNLLKSSSSKASHKTPLKKEIIKKESKNIIKNTPSNVTVNSPPSTRKKVQSLSRESSKISINNTRTKTQNGPSKNDVTSKVKRNVEKAPNSLTAHKNSAPKVVKKETAAAKSLTSKEVGVRVRQNTRTLEEEEIKVLKDGVDNDAEMKKLTQKLMAKPKSFYVDLQNEKRTKSPPPEPDQPSSEASYEDDFESYASDFESYHGSSPSDDVDDEASEMEDGGREKEDTSESEGDDTRATERGYASEKARKDEERMLDSGNFDLHESRRSANAALSSQFKMADISECREIENGGDEKKMSLTDEGFQEMSQSSAVGSMKHVDVVESSMTINFEKPKPRKRSRLLASRLRRRYKDLQNMITLHEMYYSLYEMQPIPYDLYMATFGRNNYTQCSTQTFDDGNTVEIQTEVTFTDCKWTQHPVEFSSMDVCLNFNCKKSSDAKINDDFLSRFRFLFETEDKEVDIEKTMCKEYLNNPLRIFLEQKDGVGDENIFPIENYENKLRNFEYSKERLCRFLKKSESKISSILNLNAGNTNDRGTLRSTNIPFSKGFTVLYDKNDRELSYLKQRQVSKVTFSRTKSNLVMTVFQKQESMSCIACLWDISVANNKPLKVLTCIDNISLSVFPGDCGGVYMATLDDNSLHLWDLSEEATVQNVTSAVKTTELVENQQLGSTHREERRLSIEDENTPVLRASSYTTSAISMMDLDYCDVVVGLEYIDYGRIQDGGQRVFGQVSVLQRNGTLTLWSVVQDKSADRDLGKAYWSKIKLQRGQTIKLKETIDNSLTTDFNLTATKRRLSSRRSTSNLTFDSGGKQNGRPFSAARKQNQQNSMGNNWDIGLMLCTDLQIMKFNRSIVYLVSKNNGEVLICNRLAGVMKVERFSVAGEISTVTTLKTSTEDMPYFLAGTDAGTLHLCSLSERRVLLTLDNRDTSVPEPHQSERCVGDHKGRYLGTVPVKPVIGNEDMSIHPTTSLQWPSNAPCRLLASVGGHVTLWDLTRGDLRPRWRAAEGQGATLGEGFMATWTSNNEVQIHRLLDEDKEKNQLIFNKYVALL